MRCFKGREETPAYCIPLTLFASRSFPSLEARDEKESRAFSAKKQEKFYDKPLKELKTKDNCLIACILRNNSVIIPDGNTCITLGDNVIVVTTHKNFDDLTDIFL